MRRFCRSARRLPRLVHSLPHSSTRRRAPCLPKKPSLSLSAVAMLVVALSSTPKPLMEVLMARVPSSEQPPTDELDQLRAENAQLEQRLAEMQRTIGIYAAAS